MMISRSHIYDNWERLVAAVLRKEELWKLFHEDSRTPSIRSESSSSSFRSNYSDVPFAYSAPYTNGHQPNLVFVADTNPDFGFEDLLGASAEFLGKGTFGRSFTAFLNNGIQIVVKELKSVNMSEAEFGRSIEIVGNVKHENVVPLKAYFYSKDEKLMLYDYYSAGSVATLLHGRNGEKQDPLDWQTRLRIALGAARGIAHIHSQRVIKLVHGKIRSSNIFLNSRQYGTISDFGLASMIDTTFTQTDQYHAPEVKSTRDVSQASDVYSFGILLLELLTRVSPVPTNSDVAVDLTSWVNSFRREEWVPKVLDMNLVKKNPNIKDEMVKLLQMGIRCVEKTPKKRPKMSSVVKKIEAIRVVGTSDNVPTTVNAKTSLVFLDGCDHGLDLEDLLRASAEVPGKGMLGTSYKVKLESGIIVVVKRLRFVIATTKEFEKHVEFHGRGTHNNVARLKAYYYSSDDKLLVYDLFDAGSLSAILHGNRGAGRKFLDWETRVRIALGAARGIAYIHRQDNHKLVHGNIRSTNIFLNERKYGCIADAGLSALVSLTMESAVYRAPEVTDTSKVSQAADVYNFGIVLIELVSGRTPLHIGSDRGNISLVEWIYNKDWSSEVYDKELLSQDNNQVAISQVFRIALNCVATVPENRPKMYEVVQMLEEIKGADDGDDAPSIATTLENLRQTVTTLEDLLPKLTKLSIETRDQL